MFRLSLCGNDWVVSASDIPVEFSSRLEMDGGIRKLEFGHKLAAVVPGEVHMDLMRNNIIGDPQIGSNEKENKWIYLVNWRYEKKFNVEKELLSKEYIFIYFQGINTVAEVKLNGNVIGKTDSMFIDYHFDIKHHLVVGINILSVDFTPAPLYARIEAQKHPYEIPHCEYPNSEPHWNFVRTGACLWVFLN
jgi:beta-mannosidase